MIGGAGVLVAANGSLTALRQGLYGGLVLAAGLGLILAPWLWRLTSELAEERRERIRSQERAELAAHLHDSVLQTLAVIQRRADHPREVVSLARRQERELRSWLYGTAADRAAQAAPDTIGAVIERVADDVETDLGVRVEVVRVGDCAADEALLALGQPPGEAIANAAKHSGADDVSVYLEVEPEKSTSSCATAASASTPRRWPTTGVGSPTRSVARLARDGGRADGPRRRRARAPRSSCRCRGGPWRDPGLPGRRPPPVPDGGEGRAGRRGRRGR